MKPPKWWTLFEDVSGGYSSIRVILLFWMLVLISMWIFGCVNKKEMVAIPDSVVTLTLGLAAVKGLQRFGEKDNEPPTPPVVPPTQ